MKKQFSKDKFVFIINSLKEEADTISSLYKEYSIDLMDCSWLLNENSVISLLKFIFDDEETEWIDWWCWEKDFGRNKKIDAFLDDDSMISLETPEEFYDFLIENMENKNGRTDFN